MYCSTKTTRSALSGSRSVLGELETSSGRAAQSVTAARILETGDGCSHLSLFVSTNQPPGGVFVPRVACGQKRPLLDLLISALSAGELVSCCWLRVKPREVKRGSVGF